MRLAGRFLVLSTALVLAAGAARALGMETYGNSPLSDANYRDWPGLMPVINHESRIYAWWVNGNEQFFYEGDAEAANGALRRLAAAADLAPEVVLRPGPATTQNFARDKTLAYDWNLHVIGGVAAHLRTRDRGDRIWVKHPVLTLRTGGKIDLARLSMPPGLKVTRLAQLKQRYREALDSRDQTVRGWGAGELAALDPYDEAGVTAIQALLADPDNWVRLNAAGSLATFGRKARPALPALRAARATEDARLRERIDEAIRTIEAAPDTSAAEQDHADQLRRIDAFLAVRKE